MKPAEFIALAILGWIALQITQAVQGREYALHLMMVLTFLAEGVWIVMVIRNRFTR